MYHRSPENEYGGVEVGSVGERARYNMQVYERRRMSSGIVFSLFALVAEKKRTVAMVTCQNRERSRFNCGGCYGLSDKSIMRKA